MQSIKFTAISGGDWSEILEVYDADTNLPLTDIDTGVIQLQIQAAGNNVVLNLTTADSTITRPASGQFQWVVSTASMSAFCPGQNYHVGCRHINDAGGTTALFTGSLTYVDGGYEWR